MSRRTREADGDHLDLEFLPDGTDPPVRLRREPGGMAAVDAEVAVAEVELAEDEVTDEGQGTRPLSQVRPFAELPHEERLCRLLEEIVENTRLTSVRLGALEHQRLLEDPLTLDLQGGEEPPKGWLETTRHILAFWVLDPDIKRAVVKAFVVCSTAGGSLGGSWATVALAFEFIERLLRAWVELP